MKTKSKFKISSSMLFLCFILNSLIFPDNANSEQSSFLLPENLIPESYNLVIYTNLKEEAFGFSGNVLIKIKCVQQTDKVILHAKDLTIIQENVTVKLDETNQIEIQSHEYDKKVDFYIINLKTDLQPETFYSIYIPFEAELGVGATGYYRTSYTDAEGKTKWISVTLFDPIHARRAFPCWDELIYKVKVSISLAHDENLTAISNMKLASRDQIDEMPGWIMSRFEESPPLPMSNVAFLICDFDNKLVELPPENTQLRIWTRKELLYQAELASDSLSKALPYVEKLFDMKYPQSKMDIVALPHYGAGSESHFGLGLIKETGLLFDPKSNGEYNRRNFVSDVCWIVSQQWFNNIVTGKGWEGMWLGTGLVDFFVKAVVDQLYPDWTYGYHNFADQFITVLSADSSKTSHALQVTIEKPDMIEQFYDDITFNKGSYVLRMLSTIVGNDVFQLGVNNFLKEHKFGSADQFDLWKMLSETTQKDIEGLMSPWTLKPGFPYLFIDVDLSKKAVTVTQERFLFDDKNKEEEAERKKYCWPVALTFTTSVEANFKDSTVKQWITCDGPTTFPLELAETDWVIFNIGLLVPCRINYSKTNWDSILKTLADETRFQEIEVRNRMQIVDDLFAFAAADIFDYAFVLDAIKYLHHEPEFSPWGVALSAFSYFQAFFRRTELYEPFRDYVRKILDPVYSKLGKFGELPKDYYLGGYKYQMTFWACEYGVDSCRKSCLETLRTWEAEPEPDKHNPINIDVRGFVYCQALAIGDANDWDFLWQRYLNARGPIDKGTLLQTIGCTQLKDKLQNLLDWSLDPKVFKPEDSPEVFLRVSGSGVAHEMCRNFFMQRFQDIYNYLSGNPNLLGQYLPLLYASIRTPQELKELNDFVETIRPQLVGTETSLNEAVDYANEILAWLAKNQPVFAKILQHN